MEWETAVGWATLWRDPHLAGANWRRLDGSSVSPGTAPKRDGTANGIGVSEEKSIRRKPGLGRGVLHADRGASVFHVKRYSPSAGLASFVEHIWTVRWDRRGQLPYTQVNLPDPAVHISFERGQSALLGPAAGPFVKVLDEWGHVFAVKLRPGGLHRFWQGSVASLKGRALTMEAAFGAQTAAIEARVLDVEPAPNLGRDAERTDAERAQFLDDTLCRWAKFDVPARDLAIVQQACEQLLLDRRVSTVEDVAAEIGVSKRTLQRLFRVFVGYSPKWIAQRGRLQDAAQHLAARQDTVTTIAHHLGYADTAHFTRAFKAVTGLTPSAFAEEAKRELSESGPRPPLKPTRDNT